MNPSVEQESSGGGSLRNLAPERQQSLYEYLEGFGEEKGHSYAQSVAWLKSNGVEATKRELREWRLGYSQRLRFQWCGDMTGLVADVEKKAEESLTDESIQDKGGRLFNMLAAKTCDDQAWTRTRSVQARRQAMTALERKLELEIQKYEEARPKIEEVESSPEMTQEEKEERIRQILSTD